MSGIAVLFQVLAALSFVWSACVLALHLAGRFRTAPVSLDKVG